MAPEGFLPPQAIDLEQSVLGSSMTNLDAAHEMVAELGPVDEETDLFYRVAHTFVYQAAYRLVERQVRPDLLSVTDELRKMGKMEQVGGAGYLVELTARVVTSQNQIHHCRLLKEKWIARQQIVIAENLKLRSYAGQEDVFELTEQAIADLARLGEVKSGGRKPFFQLGKAVVPTMGRIAEEVKDGLVGYPSGIRQFDQLTDGFEPGMFYIVAARPSTGKTAFGVNLAHAIAMQEDPVKQCGVLFHTIEMSARAITLRFIARFGRINSRHLKKNALTEWEQNHLGGAIARMQSKPIYVNDTAGLTPIGLQSSIRQVRKIDPSVKVVVIDYLGLMRSGERQQSEHLEISHIAEQLKAIAKEHDIAVVALQQLTRDVAKQAREPQLQDLRQAGEEPADVVAFLHNPDPNQEFIPGQGRQVKMFVRKNRDGPVGEFGLTLLPEFSEFQEPGTLIFSQMGGWVPVTERPAQPAPRLSGPAFSEPPAFETPAAAAGMPPAQIQSAEPSDLGDWELPPEPPDPSNDDDEEEPF